MIAFLILTGLLLFVAVFAVIWIAVFVVAIVRFKQGKISQEDLDKATKFCQANRAKRQRRREASHQSSFDPYLFE